MAKPLDPKEIVTVQELAVCNMLEVGASRELLFEKGIIREDEFIARFQKLDREMKEKGEEDELLDMMETMGVQEDIVLSQPAGLRLQDYLDNSLLLIVS